MVNWKEEPSPVPWLPVHADSKTREPVAPSKPAVPARSAFMLHPEPVEVESPEADIIAPVTLPPSHEIMPTDAHAPWEAVPVFAIPTDSSAPAAVDPIQSLGDAAVRRASLSASGAATPLGGVAPVVPATPATSSAPVEHPPASTDPAPTPVSPYQVSADANPAPASALAPATTAPGFMAATPPTSAQSPPRSSTPELEDPEQPFAPAPSEPPMPDPADGDAGDGNEPPTHARRTPWWRSWPFLVLVGLLVMGGIAYGIITALSDSEPVELTPPVIVAEPEEPTHQATSIEDPTEFQQALPETVGLYALTGYDSPEVTSLDLLVRAAEATILTYQHDDITLSVRAIQHFEADTALEHFDAIAAEGTNRLPVSAGGVDVGERVNLTAQDGETIVWRNTSAIFFVTGPAQEAEEFFTNFPL